MAKALATKPRGKRTNARRAPAGVRAHVDAATAAAADGMLGPNPFIGLRLQDVLGTLRKIGRQAVTQPVLVVEQEAALLRELASIIAGRSKVVPAAGDRRFSDPTWTENPLYRRYLQAYLSCGNALDGFISRSGLDAKSKQRGRFLAATLTSALAPTNGILGNPSALKAALETGGRSLVKGLSHAVSDIRHNRAMPTQVDRTAFELGKNVAVSKGAVVFRNDVLEIIQYAPLTAKVRARPHLIVPPQINKYYVFDLAPGKSMVEHLAKSEFQVFVVSWRNPTRKHREWGMDMYVSALREGIAAICEITASDDVIVHAACSGAMTTAALLGHLAAKGDRSVHAATLMVAVLGGSTDSVLGMFATPETIAAAKRTSAKYGVLRGEDLGRVFAWLRPDDLIWNYWVNNYLLGKTPPAYDVLFWNNDSTRLPARFHAQLLDIFAGDLFRKRRALKVLGTPIDITKVKCDKYVVAGTTDHITPWAGVYEAARSFGGRNQFVLSSSGHIQSLVNPPGNPKAKYFLNAKAPATAERWLAGAQAMPGSWWGHWVEWLSVRSGDLRPAPATLGSAQHTADIAAPGRYALEP